MRGSLALSDSVGDPVEQVFGGLNGVAVGILAKVAFFQDRPGVIGNYQFASGRDGGCMAVAIPVALEGLSDLAQDIAGHAGRLQSAFDILKQLF